MSPGGRELAQAFSVLKAGRWLLATAVLVAAVAAYANSLTQPNRYSASAQLLFGLTTPADTVAGGAAAAGDPARQAATTLALASLDRVAARTRRKFSGPVTVDDLKNAVSVTATGTSDLLTVTAEWSTPAQSAALANAFADSIVALRQETATAEVQRSIDALNATIRAAKAAAPRARPSRAELRTLRARVARLRVLRALQTGDVQIVQRATLPKGPISPRPVRNAVLAGLLVLLLGAGLLLVRSRFDQRLRGEEELTSLIPAPVLARVPDTRRSPATDLDAATHDAAFVEAFEFLRMNLQLMEVSGSARARTELEAETGRRRTRDAHGRFTAGRDADRAAGADRRLVVAVTSPVAGSGKTTTVCWLARSLAASGERLVAVDLDLRNPSLHERFGIAQAQEPGDMTAPPVPYGPPPQDGSPSRRGELRLLTGGHGTPVAVGPAGDEPREPGLQRRQQPPLSEMLRGLRAEADYVLVDTSPVATVAHASAVAAAADGVILVVDLERTRRKDVLTAKRQLDNAHARILGMVVNRARDNAPTYHAAPAGGVALDGPAFDSPPTAGALR